MTTYIVIDEQTFKTNTEEEIAVARAALRDAELDSADEFVGEPDGLGDSYKNGNKLFAKQSESIEAVDGNDYTFAEWLAAAGRSDSTSEYDLRAAWRAGEDPAEYEVAGV